VPQRINKTEVEMTYDDFTIWIMLFPLGVAELSIALISLIDWLSD